MDFSIKEIQMFVNTVAYCPQKERKLESAKNINIHAFIE